MRGGLRLLVAGSFLGALACATAPSSSELLQNLRLVKRASFDLDCTEPLGVTNIDDKTRGVRGCGRQATYVELCDAPVGIVRRTCVWVKDN
jgi:hypothetical protein